MIHEYLEAIHRQWGPPDHCVFYRTVTRLTLTETRHGHAPQWWKPPHLDFRVTERMRWYHGETTYADAVYSGLDPTTNTLWIFDCSEQHEQLWRRGAVPEGTQFKLGGTQDQNAQGGFRPQPKRKCEDV